MPYCWEVDGADYFFHYTEPAMAEAIVRRERFVVGAADLFGEGFYASRLEPTGHTQQELRQRLFFNLWPEISVCGVVVLAASELPFVHCGGDIYRLSAAQGTEIDLSGIVVGRGERTGDSWRFDASLCL